MPKGNFDDGAFNQIPRSNWARKANREGQQETEQHRSMMKPMDRMPDDSRQPIGPMGSDQYQLGTMRRDKLLRGPKGRMAIVRGED